ncbi:TGM1 [Mytilus edulis]|uniref:TGM1 n=1 Tax=Mytilus edulis TaxID=6550 RepID=A0A8S3RY74_MYTED|nr:TGM1 [Mytilus edulis]
MSDLTAPKQTTDGDDAVQEPVLSKRAQRKQKRLVAKERRKEMKKLTKGLTNNKQNPGFDKNLFDAAEYYFENGLRKVYPYYFTFSSFCKQRWNGKTVLDIFTKDFHGTETEEYIDAIESGRVTVNGKPVSIDYKVKNHDFLEHTLHRHENPVSGSPLKIIHDDKDVVVINKPPSIPCHPCGRYRFNSIAFILGKEYGYPNLRNIYRLDRLTSGVLILAKTPEKTRQLEDEIFGKHVQKEYVCRVVGEFPQEEITCDQPLDLISHKISMMRYVLTFEYLFCDLFIVFLLEPFILGLPYTGRTHQIRVHLQFLGYPIINDPLYNSAAFGPNRGKGGEFWKSDTEITNEIQNLHSVGLWYDGENPLYHKRLKEIKENQVNKEIKEKTDGTDCDVKCTDSETKTGIESSESGTRKDSIYSDTEIDSLEPKEKKAKIDHTETEDKISKVTLGKIFRFRGQIITKDGVERKIVYPTFDESKWLPNEHCSSCKRNYIDPGPTDLVMYLHALSYKGSDWGYSTELPEWAKENWQLVVILKTITDVKQNMILQLETGPICIEELTMNAIPIGRTTHVVHMMIATSAHIAATRTDTETRDHELRTRREENRTESREVTREERDEELREPEKDKEVNKKFHVNKVDLNIKSNTADHHTDKYMCTKRKKDPDFVIRRGQSFKMTITFDRSYNNEQNEILFTFKTGKSSRPSNKTQAQIIMNENTSSRSKDKKEWFAKLLNKKENSIDVEVTPPCTCIIGEWRFTIQTESKIKDDGDKLILMYKHNEDVIILLNPWCPDDQVFMGTEQLLDEYILNESGAIWSGNYRQMGVKPWNFGQFRDGILDTCLHLIRKAYNNSVDPAMSDPVKLARAITKMVNAPDDNGVLVGNWSGDYSGGTPPMKWVGSVAILEEYTKNQGTPVQFGQCWVFSGLTTTVCRAIGLPARSVTNFASAHDTDGSTCIDKAFVKKGEDLEKVDIEGSSDSIWNFHVWNEAWISRPDLGKGYDGWQVIDATPQELSSGVYQCGPAPVTAIKKGEIGRPFDAPFIFAEVNADIVHWEILPNDSWVIIKTDSNDVGKNISTKKPDGRPYNGEASVWRGYGEKYRLDVTSEYKYPEGSLEERLAVQNADNEAKGGRDVFATDSVRERENDDVVSLAPGHRERHDIGLLSEDESSLKSETENPQKSSSRFSKYVKGNESDSDENNNDHLKSLFGDDVKTKKETSSGGLILDKSQIDILSGSWRCKNPERLTAYNDEYRHSFPVHEKTSDILKYLV